MQSNRLEKIGTYIACLAVVFMFWQAWRDFHNDISGIKERLKYVETELSHKQDKI